MTLTIATIQRRWRYFLALLILQVLDVVTTLAVLDQGGFEGNPIMRVIAHGDPWRFLAVKVGAAIVVGGLVMLSPEDRSIDRSLLYVILMYVGVVGWNTYLIGA